MELYARTLHPAVGNDVRGCLHLLPVPEHKPFPQTAPIVRTRFVTTRNNIGFASKKAQTISFIERGFERLGLGRRTVVWIGSSQQISSEESGDLYALLILLVSRTPWLGGRVDPLFFTLSLILLYEHLSSY